MTAEKLTVTVDDSDVVKLNETLGDTEKQLKDVEKAADEAGEAVEDAGEAAGGMEAAMGALGVAVGIAGAALAVAAGAAAVYTEKTAESETAMNTFLNSMDRFNLSLGEAIVESEGMSQALGIFDHALNNSEGFVDGFAESISGLVSGAMFVLEAAMQTGTATMGLYRLAVVAAEGAIDTIDTNIRQAAGTVEIMTLAVVDLGLSLGEGLIGMVQLAITKLGEFASAIAPYAARIGLDLSAVTNAIDGVNGGLDTQLTSLRAMREQAQNSGLTALAEQEERLAGLEERRNERGEESIAIIEETGETMMATAGLFNSAGSAIERTTRATEGAAGAVAVLNKNLQELLATQTLLADIEEKRAAFAMAQATLAAQSGKEAERQAEVNLGLKMQGEALAGIQTALEGVSSASATASVTVSENLLTLLDSLSPINQAMDVFKTGAAELGMSAVTGLTESLLSGQNVGKQFKAFIGDMLATQGKAAILQGGLQLIPFTPFFNPASAAAQILQGGLMVGAGKALGAVGGGGGGATAPTVAAPVQGSSNSTYVTNNFQGMFNDPRESARVIGDATEQAALRGTL